MTLNRLSLLPENVEPFLLEVTMGSIAKKTRFEVFKRDNFTCQYCGNTPPTIVLEIDHVIPKSRKGSNEIDNLVTSCFDCNRGKSNIALSAIPKTISEKAKIEEEKIMQLKEYNKLLKKKNRYLMENAKKVSEVYNNHFKEYVLSESFIKMSLMPFLKMLPLQSVIEAMDIACYKINWDSDKAIRYFCGICWRRIKGE